MQNKTKLIQLLSFISATMGIICIACFFFPFLAISSKEANTGFYTGFEVAFGYSDNIVKMGMNIILVVSCIILFFAAILSLMKYNNKLANIVSAIMFFIPSLAIFLLPVYAKSMGNMIIGSTYGAGLAWGSIVCGLVALICVVLNIAILILNKKLDAEVTFETSSEEQPAFAETVAEENKEN